MQQHTQSVHVPQLLPQCLVTHPDGAPALLHHLSQGTEVSSPSAACCGRRCEGSGCTSPLSGYLQLCIVIHLLHCLRRLNCRALNRSNNNIAAPWYPTRQRLIVHSQLCGTQGIVQRTSTAHMCGSHRCVTHLWEPPFRLSHTASSCRHRRGG